MDGGCLCACMDVSPCIRLYVTAYERMLAPLPMPLAVPHHHDLLLVLSLCACAGSPLGPTGQRTNNEPAKREIANERSN